MIRDARTGKFPRRFLTCGLLESLCQLLLQHHHGARSFAVIIEEIEERLEGLARFVDVTPLR